MKKTCIIVNPKAGKQFFLKFYLPLVLSVFDEKGISYEVIYTKNPEAPASIAKEYLNEVDFFTVFGGDGTLREVVKGMGDSPKPVGLIPLGTVNVLAQDLGIPFDPIQAAFTIVEGYQRKIDVAYANQEPFILMLSIGIDAEAVHNVDLELKKWIGPFSYIFAAIKSLIQYAPKKVKIRLPEKNIEDEGYIVLVSNCRFYGGRFVVDEKTSIDDGILNLFLFKRGSIRDTFRLFMGVLTKSHTQMKDLSFYTAKKIEIITEKKVRAQNDGDPAPSPPFVITVKPKFVSIFVPKQPYELPSITKRYLNSLFRKLFRDAKKILN